MAEECEISAAMVSEERSYVLKLDGYSRAKALLENGEFVTSAPFSAGGYDWTVELYPNGDYEGYSDFISVSLCRLPDGDQDVKAKYRLSLLDKNGEPVPSYTRASKTISASPGYGSAYGHTDFIKKADLEASPHLTDDCLTIRCDITIIHDEETRVPPSNLHRHLGDLLYNKDAADLTFQVGGQSFSAHRCVLAARSSVFKADLLGPMEESYAAGPIEICDMEADVFDSLLHFIYTDTVPPVLDVVMAGHLLVAADRYNIERLRMICEEKLCSHIDSDMVATSLALAEQHGFHALKKACLKFLASPSNLEAMMASDGYEHLKSSCPSVFKELVAGILPAELKAAKDIIMTMWK